MINVIINLKSTEILKINMENKDKELFFEYYKKEILPDIKHLEPLRVKYCSFLIAIFILFFVLPLIMLLCGFLNMFNFDSILHKYFIIFLTAGWILINIFPYIFHYFFDKFRIIFSKETKKADTSKLINFFGNIAWHKHDPLEANSKNIKMQKFILEPFSQGCNCFFDDELIGKYRETPFHAIEMNTRFYGAIPSATSRAITFKKILLTFKLKKGVSSNIEIFKPGRREVFATYFIMLFVYASLALIIIFNGESTSWKINFIIFLPIIAFLLFKIIKNSIDIYHDKEVEIFSKKIKKEFCFNTNFQIYSVSKKEIEKFVTPAFLERLLFLKKAYQGGKLECHINGKKLLIAINTTKNLFDIGNLFYPLSDKKNSDAFYSEIEAIYQLIDYLKLYEQLYSKS